MGLKISWLDWDCDSDDSECGAKVSEGGNEAMLEVNWSEVGRWDVSTRVLR